MDGLALILVLLEDQEVQETEPLDDKSSLIKGQFLLLPEFMLLIELEYLFIGKDTLITVYMRRNQSLDSFVLFLLGLCPGFIPFLLMSLLTNDLVNIGDLFLAVELLVHC